DAAPVWRRPRAPLAPVDRAEIAVGVGPFVPDRNAVIVEIFDVGVAAQEPQQLVDDRLEVQLLGGHERKAAPKIEPHLMAEDRARAGAGPVALLHALFQDAFHQVEILAHRCFVLWRVAAILMPNVYRKKYAQDDGG